MRSRPRPATATAADLEPARVGARRAAVEVDGLVLKRDVYYTLEPAEMRLRELRRGRSDRFDGVLRAAIRSQRDSRSSSTTTPVTTCSGRGDT